MNGTPMTTPLHRATLRVRRANAAIPAIALAAAALLAAAPPLHALPAAARLRQQATDDSTLYRQARAALSDGDYRRAAGLFQRVADEYRSSRYAPDALYWKAFALYQSGATDDLQGALASLDALRALDAASTAATASDAATLRTRIQGLLARRGDATAAEAISRVASASARSSAAAAEGAAAAARAARGARGSARAASADTGGRSVDDDMRIAALNALMQMDADQALPILKQVLARRDSGSEALRRKAVFIVAQQQTPETADILLGVIRDDPSSSVRRDAVFWLSQVPGDRTVALLDSIIRTSADTELRERAVFSLGQHEGTHAHDLLRQLATDRSAPLDLRKKAIFWLGHGSQKPEDATFLRGIYRQVGDAKLQRDILQSIAQFGGADNVRWLLDQAQDSAQDIDVRKQALFWAGQSSATTTAQLADLYDRMKDPEMKTQLIFVLSQRDDRAAVDKLIAIAKSDRDVEARKKAIFWLGQKDDPRVRQLLLDLINQ